MLTVFAKYILAAAAIIGPGTDQPFPRLEAQRADGVLEMITFVAIIDPPVECPPQFSPAPPCTPSPGGFREVKIRQICVPAGVYSLTMRLGLAPLDPDVPAFRGSVWWSAMGGDSLLVMDLEARRDAWVNLGATHVFESPGACYRLTTSAVGRATVNPDRRVTYLAIHRIGD